MSLQLRKIEIVATEPAVIIDMMRCLYMRFPDRENELLEMAATCNKGVILTISRTSKPHTRQQERYYWLWLRQFAHSTGNTPDEMHNHILRETYGTEYAHTSLGCMARPRQRSSTANREEYSELIETLIRVAAEMDFNVPPPSVSMEDYADEQADEGAV